jgi:regulator of cell morphogenesis and NO signaling
MLLNSAASPIMSTPLPDSLAHARLGELIANIEATHHTFTREALDRIGLLLDTSSSANLPNRTALMQCFQTLRSDLLPHLMKEENILFPYITALEEHPENPPRSCFGSVANPITMMQMEHASCLVLLQQMRSLTNHYDCGNHNNPASALYSALSELDQDLVLHIHWEDHVVFPRALQLEEAAA